MPTSEFTQLKNHFRRIRLKEDEKIIEQMLMELKEKHEKERQQKIEELQQQLEKIKL